MRSHVAVCFVITMSFPVKQYIKLNNGISIPLIAMGVYLTPKNLALELVYNALNVGYRHLDCAEMYGNEKEVADGITSWLQDHKEFKREEIFYTTKIFDDHQGYQNAKAAIDDCLARVKSLGYIDLMLIHSPQTNKEDRLGTWKAMEEAVQAGKIKSIGVSNYGVHHLQELLLWKELKIKPVVNQVELHPWMMRTEIVNFCRVNRIELEAYCPLARGRMMDDPFLKQMAKKYNKTPAQILIRWSLQEEFIPLPKTANKNRAVENILVFDFKILPDDVEALSHPEAYERVGGWDPVHYRG